LVKIQVESLSYGYNKDFKALDNVSIKTKEAEFLCLVGPNGSGKSTLLKCLLKIQKPTNGDVVIDGKNLDKISLYELAKIVGYVPQSNQYVFPITVFEAILTGRIPYLGWAPKESDLKKVQETLKLFNLEAYAWRYLNALSGGERQKVTIAMTVVKEPQILLLDEPTSNLDLRHQLEVMDTLKRLVRERKMSVVMAVHDLNLALKYADRVVMMKKGQVVSEGKPLEALTKENIQSVFGVEVEVANKTGEPYIRPICPSLQC
jgi:iron complex transport system ATP-binding protein